MTRQVRRFVLALTVFAASGAVHGEAHADELARKLCTIGCGAGSIDCMQNNGSDRFCAGFAAGCMVGCKMAI